MTEQLTNLTHLHSETGPAFILVFVLFDSDSLDIILLFVSVCLCKLLLRLCNSVFFLVSIIPGLYIEVTSFFEICNDNREID